MPAHTSIDCLTPLRYQRDLVALLKEREPALWRWVASAGALAEQAEELRTQLLKVTYRLDPEGHPGLTEQARAVAARLGVTSRVTLYQAAGGGGSNATLFHLAGEAHIVLTGPLLSTLTAAELDAVLAHELAHHRLHELEGGDFLVCERILSQCAGDPRADPGHVQSARRYRLYSEIFADRGALVGCGDLHAVVAALVKTATGVHEVRAESYLRQADEIFARAQAPSDGASHPETFLRARALRLWAEGDASLDEWLANTIDGPLALDELDLAGQRRLAALTRRFLAALLRPHWFQSAAALAHARAFFPDFSPADAEDDRLVGDLRFSDPAAREYLCYLLLDFAAVDPELDELPLAAALEWSRRLEIAELFEKLALKELALGKRQLNKVKKEAAVLLARTAPVS